VEVGYWQSQRKGEKVKRGRIFGPIKGPPAANGQQENKPLIAIPQNM
jgi:hypothetical protein